MTGFLAGDRQVRAAAVQRHLSGRGALAEDRAIRLAAAILEHRGEAEFSRLAPGERLYDAVRQAIADGLAAGRFRRDAEHRLVAVAPRDGDVARSGPIEST